MRFNKREPAMNINERLGFDFTQKLICWNEYSVQENDSLKNESYKSNYSPNKTDHTKISAIVRASPTKYVTVCNCLSKYLIFFWSFWLFSIGPIAKDNQWSTYGRHQINTWQWLMQNTWETVWKINYSNTIIAKTKPTKNTSIYWNVDAPYNL